MKKNDLVLALDPGKDRFAWSILDGAGHLIDTGMLEHPLQEFQHAFFRQQVVAYINEVRNLLHRHQFFAVVAERYQIRGMGSVGEICEFVNLMLGMLIAEVNRCESPKPHVDLLPAGVWKNWMSTVMTGTSGELEKTPDAFGYPFVTKQASERKKHQILPIKEHQFDSIGIGVYFVARETRVDDPYALVVETTKVDIDRLWNERL